MTKTTDSKTKALEILHAGVREHLTSETWKAALDFRKKFHTYSFNNVFLIMLQKPDAQLVAGYRAWQAKGRQVKKGEKGIAILAPILRKSRDDAGEEETRVFGFRSAYVFDVSQTEGEELPMPPAPVSLTGHDDAAAAAYDLLATFAASRGWKIAVEDCGGAMGSWTPGESTIRLAPGLPKLQAAKTLAHEIAHATAKHVPGPEDRDVREFEAETAAYLIMSEFGLDASGYSFSYVAHWAGDEEAMTKVLAAGRAATKIADEVLEGVRSEHLTAA